MKKGRNCELTMKTVSLAGMVLKTRVSDLRNADRKGSDIHHREGNDSMLRKEDGCDSAVSHVPRGVLRGQQHL